MSRKSSIKKKRLSLIEKVIDSKVGKLGKLEDILSEYEEIQRLLDSDDNRDSPERVHTEDICENEMLRFTGHN